MKLNYVSTAIALLLLTFFCYRSWLTYNKPATSTVELHQQVKQKVEWVIPAKGILSQGFKRRTHEGIDIANAVGTPIAAAATGEVTQAGWTDNGLGYSVEMSHPNGKKTVYGHNSKLLVRVGDKIAVGTSIAFMGSTGNSTGPHLHFEVYDNGRVVDPITIFKEEQINQLKKLESF